MVARPRLVWNEEEYPILFEKVYDQRSQRRIYIEECVKNAKPSWGYIYLANIIANNYFNVIFTPNFDDLLNEACFIYADCRPIVCAHDSAVADIRVTSARPKIIKLHGDFLYDSIKNTVGETETLEKNMRDKLTQFAREYGLIVIGYGGNDRSIMDTLETMLRSEGYFPNGIYWCRRKDDTMGKKVERLLGRENAYLIEIEGFDEFMAELHDALGLTLPDAVRDPYKATTEKLNRFILAREEVKHRIIKNDIAGLEKQVKRFEQAIFGKLPKEELDSLIPYRFLGDMEFEHYNYERALLFYEKALVQNPNDLVVMRNIACSYVWIGRTKEALQTSEEMIKLNPTESMGYEFKGYSLHHLGKNKDAFSSYTKALEYASTEPTGPMRDARIRDIIVFRSFDLLSSGKWKEALSDAEKALEICARAHFPSSIFASIAKSMSLKKLGRKEEAKKIIQDVLKSKHGEDARVHYQRAMAFALFGKKTRMLQELDLAIKMDVAYKVTASFNPVFTDYRKDPDFRKLAYKR